jgi:branched-chain amino acid transport system substrate-binding protein
MRRSALVLLLAAVTTTSGCAATQGVLDRFTAQGDGETPIVTIGVLAPLSGGQSRTGRSVVDAVEQAVADSGGVAGWQVEVAAYDLAADTVDETVDDLRGADDVLMVVTGFGSDDVRAIVPRLDSSGLTVLSPADSDPRHTRGADPSAPLRPWAGYVSVAVDPAPQQAALADYLVRVVGSARVVLVSDGTPESATRARQVQADLSERGVTDAEPLVASGGAPTEPITSALQALEPGDAVVVDGPATLAAQVAALRPAGVVLGLTEPLADLAAGQAAALQGAVAALPGLDPRRGADELRAAFEASGRDATEGEYGPSAYDGARLLTDALTRCLPEPGSRSPSRSACRTEVAGATWGGLTGAIQFDEFGARIGLLPTVVTLRDSSWAQPGT